MSRPYRPPRRMKPSYRPLQRVVMLLLVRSGGTSRRSLITTTPRMPMLLENRLKRVKPSVKRSLRVSLPLVVSNPRNMPV
uniref:Uncharacterized protein n=1 Tax=uncultured marine virus TaxID=186617 RepID=A0A0F7L8A3_9VIRU|nr:hypothetical protein [uncultured marine virus]